MINYFFFFYFFIFFAINRTKNRARPRMHLSSKPELKADFLKGAFLQIPSRQMGRARLSMNDSLFTSLEH